jgi:hypothetical protein
LVGSYYSTFLLTVLCSIVLFVFTLCPVSNVACICGLPLWFFLTFIRLFFVFYSYIFNKTRMQFLMRTLWNWTVGLQDFYLGTNVFHYCIIYIVIKMVFFSDVAPLQSTNVKPQIIRRTNNSAGIRSHIQHQESSVLYLHTYIYKCIIIIEK